MSKFYDNENLLEIEMVDKNGTRFENDFFEAGGLPYSEELDAYKVADVYYLVDYATSYAAGKNPDIDNEYDDDGELIAPFLVHFFDGENKLYNMKPLLQKNIFSPLKDISLFTKLNIDPGGYGISWTEDIDISCDELYENGRQI